MHRLFLLLLAPILAAASEPETVLDVDVQKLRNSHGVVHACLTRNPAHFPDCRGDPAALKQSVPAGKPQIHFAGFVPGVYALTLFHDENANHRLDKMMGIPKEGFGFSRSPVVRFGPPSFDNVRIDLAPGITRATVRMQYIL